jgi:hypothetical protein
VKQTVMMVLLVGWFCSLVSSSRAEAETVAPGAACSAKQTCKAGTLCLNSLCRDSGMLMRETRALSHALCSCRDVACVDAPLQGMQRLDADYSGIELSDEAKAELEKLLNEAGRCLNKVRPLQRWRLASERILIQQDLDEIPRLKPIPVGG